MRKYRRDSGSRRSARCGTGASSLLVLGEVRDPAFVPEAGERIADIRVGRDLVIVQLNAESRRLGKPELSVVNRVPTPDEPETPGNVEVAERFLDREVRR